MFGCIPLRNAGSGHNVGLAHDYLVSILNAYPAELSIWYLTQYSWNVCSHKFHVVGEVYCRYPVVYLYFKASLSLLSSLLYDVQVVIPPDHAIGDYIPAVHVQGILFWQ